MDEVFLRSQDTAGPGILFTVDPEIAERLENGTDFSFYCGPQGILKFKDTEGTVKLELTKIQPIHSNVYRYGGRAGRLRGHLIAKIICKAEAELLVESPLPAFDLQGSGTEHEHSSDVSGYSTPISSRKRPVADVASEDGEPVDEQRYGAGDEEVPIDEQGYEFGDEEVPIDEQGYESEEEQSGDDQEYADGQDEESGDEQKHVNSDEEESGDEQDYVNGDEEESGDEQASMNGGFLDSQNSRPESEEYSADEQNSIYAIQSDARSLSSETSDGPDPLDVDWRALSIRDLRDHSINLRLAHEKLERRILELNDFERALDFRIAEAEESGQEFELEEIASIIQQPEVWAETRNAMFDRCSRLAAVGQDIREFVLGEHEKLKERVRMSNGSLSDH
ncbi:hypothetical protein DFS34DRAFT_648700 [Phlyctochytrium arcticum]|nr:hypothetical protein DFS34DRAFT_648700 [Phlyctochytrium arcticum]